MLSAYSKQHQTFWYSARFILIVRKKRRKVKWVICFFDWFPHHSYAASSSQKLIAFLLFCFYFRYKLYIFFKKYSVGYSSGEMCFTHGMDWISTVLRINTDLRPLVHRLHNPDHIALTDCHTAARVRIASRTMQKDGRTLAKSTFRVVINCQHIIIMRNIWNQVFPGTFMRSLPDIHQGIVPLFVPTPVKIGIQLRIRKFRSGIVFDAKGFCETKYTCRRFTVPFLYLINSIAANVSLTGKIFFPSADW